MRLTVLLFCIGGISALTVYLVVHAANALQTGNTFRPEIVLPLLVVTGVVALLATLAIAAAAFGLFDLADKNQALALPAGSVQAVIALSLILIFAVVALFTRSETGRKTYRSSGLTPVQYRALPRGQVVGVNRTAVHGKIHYAVVRSVEDPNAKDIDTQLLTTVSTLVVAVAGFYFGSRSAQEGSESALEAAAPNRSVRILDPPSPHLMRSKTLKIRVQSVPPGAPLRWSMEGDNGKLARLEDGSFEYEPGASDKSGKTVTLRFEQVEDPTASASLIVAFPKAGAKRSAKEKVG